MLTLKTTFENDTRRRQWSSNEQSMAGLKKLVYETYGFPPNANNVVTLKYVDDDGDLITLGSEVELREAIHIAEKKNNNVVRISVFRRDVVDDKPSSSSSSSSPAAAATPVEAKKVDSTNNNDDDTTTLFSLLRNVFEGKQQSAQHENIQTFLEKLGIQLKTSVDDDDEDSDSDDDDDDDDDDDNNERIRLALESFLARTNDDDETKKQ